MGTPLWGRFPNTEPRNEKGDRETGKRQIRVPCARGPEHQEFRGHNTQLVATAAARYPAPRSLPIATDKTAL